MNQLENAVTAAFVMEGLTSFNFHQVQAAWHSATKKGAFELTMEVMRYVPAILAIRAAGDAVHGSCAGDPGAFQDDVSVSFGVWIGSQVIDGAGTLPSYKDAVEYIAALARCSFTFNCQSALDADDAIGAAASHLIAAQ